MSDFPVDGDGLIRIESTRRLGIPDRALSRAATAGTVTWLAPGIYAPPAERRPEARHRLRVLGERTHPGHVISHSSAAVLHGLEMLSPDLSRLHVTVQSGAQGYRRTRRHLHPGRLADSDVVQIDGMWATSLERTAFDVARTTDQQFAGALAVLDSALRLGADPIMFDRLGGIVQAGVRTARTALRYADPLAENPGESWGRAQMIANGLPTPRLQKPLYRHGYFVARPDYDWRDEVGRVRVVGEFDGISKYLKYIRDGETPEDAIKREKAREGKLQDVGIVVVRWGWADLHANRVVPRIRAQLDAIGLLPRASNS